MQKQDLIFFVAAIVIVIVLATVVKPVMNGEPVQILPAGSSSQVSGNNIPIPSGAPSGPYVPSVIASSAQQDAGWDGLAKNIQFVDPSSYNINFDSKTDFGYHIPGYEPPMDYGEDLIYATIDGQWAATTQIFNIPFPIWKMEVSIEAVGDVGVGGNQELTTEQIRDWIKGDLTLLDSNGEEVEHDNETQYLFLKHFIIPSINIQVMDAGKPDGIKYIFNSRTEGMLKKDPDEDWVKAYYGGEDGSDPERSGEATEPNEDFPWRGNLDEYYWTHTFRESGDYYFIIDPNMLKSYKIVIKVPAKYAGSEGTLYVNNAGEVSTEQIV